MIIKKGDSISAPFWSVLPSIPLRGVGTPLVESIEHYAARLAWMTGTRVNRILKIDLPIQEPRDIYLKEAGALDGPRISNKSHIVRLETLTGVDTLRCGSFYVLNNLLSKTAIGRSSLYHRWCPECFRDWNEETSWEPLQWSIGLRVTCPIHQCDLEDRCRRCNARKRGSVLYSLRRKCKGCRADLGGEGRRSNQSHYVRWSEGQISRLVELCATPSQALLPADTFKIFAKEVWRYASSDSYLSVEGMSALERLLRVDRKHRNPNRHVRLTLRSLINACVSQSINVDELLLNPKEAASVPLVPLWGEYKHLELSLAKPADQCAALEHCLRTLIEDAQLYCLPNANLAMKEMNIQWKVLTSSSRRTINHYKQRYGAQGSGSLLIERDQIFKATLTHLKTMRTNPFATPNSRRAAKYIAKMMRITFEEAMSMVRCATRWRRIVELSKAHTLGLHGHQLQAYKRLGNVVDDY